MNPYLDLYLSNNYNLIRVTKNKKVPISSETGFSAHLTMSQMQIKKLKTHKGNFAIVLQDEDLIVDVDPRNGGFKAIDELFNDLGTKYYPTVITPRGGYHFYFKKPKNIDVKKNVSKYIGIDFLSKGAICLIAGCETPFGSYEFSQDELKTKLKIDFLAENNPIFSLISKKNVIFLQKKDNLDVEIENSATENEIKSLLLRLNNDCPNEEWVKIGLILYRWDKKLGLKLWEEWSKGGKTYKFGETERRWGSFATVPDRTVNLGTLYFLAKKHEAETSKLRLNELLTLIDELDIAELEYTVPQYIKSNNFNNLDKDIIYKKLQSRYKTLTQSNITLSAIKKEYDKKNHVDTSWVDNFVYVNSHNAYCYLHNLELYKKEAFNIFASRYMPLDDKGTKQLASTYVLNNASMRIVNSTSYLPYINETIIERYGHTILNTFELGSLPAPAKKYTDKGLVAIDMILNHCKLLCNKKEYSDILIQWLAYNVQNPGRKILWSPIIQSVQGLGKSFFTYLLQTLLGNKNVGVVNPKSVLNGFNNWATGVCVNVLEELRIKGQNRHEITNSLKPLITDRTIEIHPKGVNPYTTENTTNYICFTNFKDALPVTEDDRRWWIISCNISSLDQLSQIVKKSINDYYNDLFDALENNKGDVVKYFRDYPLSNEFLSCKQAPMTDYKKLAISTSENDIEFLSDIREMLEQGGEYYNRECFSTFHLLSDALIKIDDFVKPNTQSASHIFKALNYSKFPKRIYINGRGTSIWVKNYMTLSDIKESLNIT